MSKRKLKDSAIDLLLLTFLLLGIFVCQFLGGTIFISVAQFEGVVGIEQVFFWAVFLCNFGLLRSTGFIFEFLGEFRGLKRRAHHIFATIIESGVAQHLFDDLALFGNLNSLGHINIQFRNIPIFYLLIFISYLTNLSLRIRNLFSPL